MSKASNISEIDQKISESAYVLCPPRIYLVRSTQLENSGLQIRPPTVDSLNYQARIVRFCWLVHGHNVGLQQNKKKKNPFKMLSRSNQDGGRRLDRYNSGMDCSIAQKVYMRGFCGNVEFVGCCIMGVVIKI